MKKKREYGKEEEVKGKGRSFGGKIGRWTQIWLTGRKRAARPEQEQSPEPGAAATSSGGSSEAGIDQQAQAQLGPALGGRGEGCAAIERTKILPTAPKNL